MDRTRRSGTTAHLVTRCFPSHLLSEAHQPRVTSPTPPATIATATGDSLGSVCPAMRACRATPIRSAAGLASWFRQAPRAAELSEATRSTVLYSLSIYSSLYIFEERHEPTQVLSPHEPR